MSSTPFVKELLSLAIELAESLSARIPKSESLQRNCRQTAANLRTWRNNLPPEMEFLLKLTGDKALYRAILSPLSELLCILCQLLWTIYELGKPPSIATISRTNEAEQKIKSASPSIKKFMDGVGVWRKPTKGHTPLAVLFDQTSRRDKAFNSTERAVKGHISACYDGLMELNVKIDRAGKRHVGLNLLAGKAM
ncbi:MAG: hypothetical protein ASARMPREDX12_004995 [Alectoria sarmentosa]|nr:MAG: hypothetical protein ASARMPRED_003632 [Alectoria sarmentosa]CAD6572185.1 MAG: hypothetical protein ASARMPREDX12_004995 [Alectoria sarmentosa]